MHINLANNHLSMIPLFIANLSNLITLNITNNNLTSIIYPLISKKIETIDLSYNHFNSIPTIIIFDKNNSSSTLKYLSFANNHITHIESAYFKYFKSLQTVCCFLLLF